MARILVVEDEECWAEALSYLLRKEGFEVTVAATGPAALSEFDRRPADLVLLDLVLPQMSGVEVCRELRARSNVPSTAPVRAQPRHPDRPGAGGRSGTHRPRPA